MLISINIIGVEGLNVINVPKCNKVLNVITFGPKCNKPLNLVLTIYYPANHMPAAL